MGQLFPFSTHWWLYPAFAGLVAVPLAIDLAYHRKRGATSMRAAAAWSAAWMALAVGFCLALYLFAASHHSSAAARQVSLEFLAGYLVEESLSIDNMFVFALIFRYFAIPAAFQHRILFYGVAGAMVFRAIFISAGALLIRFEWVMVLFGLFLIFTAVRMALEKEKQIAPGDSPVIRLVCRFFPVTPELHGSRFFTRVNGVWHVTPLLIVLLFLETTDILFAVDSVPAVFGVTKEPFVVFSSNVCAVLGLRSLFFLLAGALERFHHLKYGLAVVLVFVGIKMIWLDHWYGGRFPIGISLAIIGGVLAASILWSSRTGVKLLGGLFLGLAAASVCYAVGWGDKVLPLKSLDPAALWWSAGAWVVCGVMLLRRSFNAHAAAK